MLNAHYADILRSEGFVQIGELNHSFHLTIWWNAASDKLLQVLVISIGNSVLLRADKSYYLKSVSAAGETWARDIPQLHSYLESHFPYLRINFEFARDVPPELAKKEVFRRLATDAPTRPLPTVEEVARLQRQLEMKQRALREADRLLSLSSMRSDLLTGYVSQQNRSEQAEIRQLSTQLENNKQRLRQLEHLQSEFRRKGSAGVYSFSVSSNLQAISDEQQFPIALKAVVREIQELHRYQIQQKLGGGRLAIITAEATEPATSWLELWMGGTLTPMQLHRLGPEFNKLRDAIDEHVMVTPDEPITCDGHVRVAEKHLAARVVSTVLNRLDKTEQHPNNGTLDPKNITADDMPVNIGHRVDASGHILGAAVFPLASALHTLISGSTGAGKSVAARVLVEEAATIKSLNILVLDPRNQWAGWAVAEDRPAILRRYGEFGMKADDARGYSFEYFAPLLARSLSLPEELTSLARRRSVVSLKGMDDSTRMELAADILEAVFKECSNRESDRPRVLIVIEEAHLFTRRRTEDAAKDAAARSERAMDRIAREGRKHGVLLCLVSQSMRDFARDLASIRQMAGTKLFLKNSDLEMEYATDIIGDGRVLPQLPTGVAILHNSNWGIHRVRIRPPHSKVFELPDAEIRRLFADNGATTSERALSSGAIRVLSMIQKYLETTPAPLNISRAGEIASISSKRKLLELIAELEAAGTIRTRRLQERGQPRVIELVTEHDRQSQNYYDRLSMQRDGSI